VGAGLGADVGAAAADGDTTGEYVHWDPVAAVAQALSIKAAAARTTALRRFKPSRCTETSPSRGLGALGCAIVSRQRD
jgi:hypothetical protein